MNLIGKYGSQLRLSQSKQLDWRSITRQKSSVRAGGREERRGKSQERGEELKVERGRHCNALAAREMEIEIERNENSANGFVYFESKT